MIDKDKIISYLEDRISITTEILQNSYSKENKIICDTAIKVHQSIIEDIRSGKYDK